jgi:uncharacterized protein (DUF4415 family)
MKAHYDFSKGAKNPYPKLLKKQVTLRLDESVVAYFRELGGKSQLPWQTLINLYLRNCAETGVQLDLQWRSPKAKAGA